MPVKDRSKSRMHQSVKLAKEFVRNYPIEKDAKRKLIAGFPDPVEKGKPKRKKKENA